MIFGTKPNCPVWPRPNRTRTEPSFEPIETVTNRAIRPGLAFFNLLKTMGWEEKAQDFSPLSTKIWLRSIVKKIENMEKNKEIKDKGTYPSPHLFLLFPSFFVLKMHRKWKNKRKPCIYRIGNIDFNKFIKQIWVCTWIIFVHMNYKKLFFCAYDFNINECACDFNINGLTLT